MAIVHPFDSLSWLETYSTQIILMIWTNGMLVASPLLYQARAVQFTYGNNDYYACRELWEGQTSAKIYTIILFALLFVIPLILLSFLYGSIGYKMIKRTAPGNADDRRDEAQNIMTFKVFTFVVNSWSFFIKLNRICLSQFFFRDLAEIFKLDLVFTLFGDIIHKFKFYIKFFPQMVFQIFSEEMPQRITKKKYYKNWTAIQMRYFCFFNQI